MRGDDKAMNSMKHNGQPSIDDEDSIKKTVLVNYFDHLDKTESGNIDSNITHGTSNGNNLPGSGGLNAVSPQSDTQDDFDASLDEEDQFDPVNAQPPSPRNSPSRIRPPKMCQIEAPLFSTGPSAVVIESGHRLLPRSPPPDLCSSHVVVTSAAHMSPVAAENIPETQTPPTNSPNLRNPAPPITPPPHASTPVVAPAASPPESAPTPPSHSPADHPKLNNNMKHNFSSLIIDEPPGGGSHVAEHQPAAAPLPGAVRPKKYIKDGDIVDIETRQQTLQQQIYETTSKQQQRSLALISRLLAIRSMVNNGTENEQRITPSLSRAANFDDGPIVRSKLPSVQSESSLDQFRMGSDPTPETDESDLESEVGFTNDKIGVEQKKIRQREKLEEQKTALIEAKRVWLIKSINRCTKMSKTLQNLTATKKSVEETAATVDSESCARIRPVNRKKRPKLITVPKCPPPEDDGVLSELDAGYHHILSDTRCVPLSIRLGAVLHNYVPVERMSKKLSKERHRPSRYSSDKEKQRRLRQKDQNIENNIVVPPSSLFATIEMPKYKDIDTPGFRSPDSEFSSGSSDSDEDISDRAFITRHMKAEKKEKERYYQSAINQSRKRKKLREEMNPRLASPKEESYHVQKIVRTDCYKRREYPLPDSQRKAKKQKEKISKRNRQEWRSSTTEGNGLRLKLSLRKT